MSTEDHRANAGQPWDDHQDARLRQLFERRATLDDIAQELQRTRTGVRARAELLQLLAHRPLCRSAADCCLCNDHRLRAQAHLSTLIEKAQAFSDALRELQREITTHETAPNARLAAFVRRSVALLKRIDHRLIDDRVEVLNPLS
jgi:hypothetical protein